MNKYCDKMQLDWNEYSCTSSLCCIAFSEQINIDYKWNYVCVSSYYTGAIKLMSMPQLESTAILRLGESVIGSAIYD